MFSTPRPSLYTAHLSGGNFKPTFSRFLRVESKAPVFQQEYFPSGICTT